MIGAQGRARREAGFTLVEAIVSLFVFALLSAGCVVMLSQSVGTQGRIGAAEDAMRALQTARAMLAADLAQVAPGAVGANGEQPSAFEGVGTGAAAGRGVRFMRGVGDPDPGASFATSLVAIEYLVDANGHLVRRAHAPDGGTSERVLLDSASDIGFEFNDGAAWRTEWRTPNGAPPRAVAILARMPRYGAVRISTYVGL
jgi:general secretion pathway protein J